eukprot:2779025-Rhodomonas_salina.5
MRPDLVVGHVPEGVRGRPILPDAPHLAQRHSQRPRVTLLRPCALGHHLGRQPSNRRRRAYRVTVRVLGDCDPVGSDLRGVEPQHLRLRLEALA